MLLNDRTIRHLCSYPERPLITPYNEEQLNPASYDVTLGDIIKVADWDPLNFLNPTIKPTFKTVSIQSFTEDRPYLVGPGVCFLASTVERFNLPNDLSSMFVLKSSRAREFYNHMFAGFGDPGWLDSTYTLELKNENRSCMLPIYPGLRIGQVLFFETLRVERSYTQTGHYNNQSTPQASWETT